MPSLYAGRGGARRKEDALSAGLHATDHTQKKDRAGKSLFCGRLEDDYRRAVEGDTKPDMSSNLWHLLVASDDPSSARQKCGQG